LEELQQRNPKLMPTVAASQELFVTLPAMNIVALLADSLSLTPANEISRSPPP